MRLRAPRGAGGSWGWAALALLLGVASGATRAQDPRSQVLLELSCASEIGTRELTLFANGTLRLRTRAEEEGEVMRLADLDPGELDGYLARLGDEDLSEAESPGQGTSGEWVEQCRLTLDLDPPRSPTRSFRFGRYDSLSLQLSHVVGIAEELAAVASERHIAGSFPPGYKPRPGDVLLDSAGQRFEIVRLTAEGSGAEVRAFDSPLVIYLRLEEVLRRFVALENRQPELVPEER